MHGDLYYIATGSYSALSDIPFGANDAMHISQHAPAVVWLFGTELLSLYTFSVRKQQK